jgi:hypothetical protein
MYALTKIFAMDKVKTQVWKINVVLMQVISILNLKQKDIKHTWREKEINRIMSIQMDVIGVDRSTTFHLNAKVKIGVYSYDGEKQNC